MSVQVNSSGTNVECAKEANRSPIKDSRPCHSLVSVWLLCLTVGAIVANTWNKERRLIIHGPYLLLLEHSMGYV